MRWRRFRKWAKWACSLAAATCLLAAVLSGRYWFAWNGENFQREAFSSRGIVFFRANLRRLPPEFQVIQSDGLGPGWHYGRYMDDGSYFHRHPFTPWQWQASASLRSSYLSLELPLWIPVAAAGLAAVPLWWPDARAWRRRLAGFCPACGYDRRGLAADAKCPECGSVRALPK